MLCFSLETLIVVHCALFWLLKICVFCLRRSGRLTVVLLA